MVAPAQMRSPGDELDGESQHQIGAESEQQKLPHAAREAPPGRLFVAVEEFHPDERAAQAEHDAGDTDHLVWKWRPTGKLSRC